MLRNTFFKIFCFLCIVLCHNLSFGAYIVGLEIDYEYITDKKFKVIIKHYRYCGSNSLSPLTLVIKEGKNNTEQYYNTSFESIKEVTNLCKTKSKECGTTPNQSFQGDGLEMFLSSVIIDFDSGFLKKNLNNGACTFQFGAGACCRNSAITTGSASANLWVFTEFNYCLAPKNSSAQSASNRSMYLPAYNRVTISPMSTDINDDSLAFELTLPYKDWTNTISYNTGNEPFTSYKPGGTTIINPNNDPPLGTYFNPSEGILIFSPYTIGQFSPICFKIKEFIYDSINMVYKQIGFKLTSFEYKVLSSQNYAPKFTTNYSYTVCEGDKLEFNVQTTDKPFASIKNDTTFLNFINPIKNTSLKINDTMAKLKSFTFSWNTRKNDARSRFYYFYSIVNDNHCPYYASNIMLTKILVKPRASTILSITPLACGKYEFNSTPKDTQFKNSDKFTWNVLDSVANNIIYSSNSKKDSFTFTKNGTYIVQHQYYNANSCPTIYYDTLYVNDGLDYSISMQDPIACSYSKTSYKIKIKNGNGPYQFEWFSGKTKKIGSDSVLNYTFKPNRTQTLQLSDTITSYIVYANGCKLSKSFHIYTLPKPKIELEKSIAYNCINTQVTNSVTGINDTWFNHFDNDTIYKHQLFDYTWVSNNTVKSNSNQFKSADRGQYKVWCKDNITNCYSDTIQYDILPIDVPKPTIYGDTVLCQNQSTKLISKDSNTIYQYQWRINQSDLILGNNSSIVIKPIDNTSVILIISKTIAGIVCKDSSSINVLINDNVVVRKLQDKWICKNEIFELQGSGFDDKPGKSVAYYWTRLGNRLAFPKSQIIQSSLTESDSFKLLMAVSQHGEICKDSTQVHVNLFPISKKASIQQTASDKLISSQLFNNQWHKNGKIMDGEVNRILTISQSGFYQVQYIDSNSCLSAMSDSFSITLNVATQLLESQFKIFPIPSFETINIQSISSKPFHISCYTSDGKLINTFENQLHTASISIQNKGIYILKISNSDTILYKRIIIE